VVAGRCQSPDEVGLVEDPRRRLGGLAAAEPRREEPGIGVPPDRVGRNPAKNAVCAAKVKSPACGAAPSPWTAGRAPGSGVGRPRAAPRPRRTAACPGSRAGCRGCDHASCLWRSCLRCSCLSFGPAAPSLERCGCRRLHRRSPEGRPDSAGNHHRRSPHPTHAFAPVSIRTSTPTQWVAGNRRPRPLPSSGRRASGFHRGIRASPQDSPVIRPGAGWSSENLPPAPRRA